MRSIVDQQNQMPESVELLADETGFFADYAVRAHTRSSGRMMDAVGLP